MILHNIQCVFSLGVHGNSKEIIGNVDDAASEYWGEGVTGLNKFTFSSVSIRLQSRKSRFGMHWRWDILVSKVSYEWQNRDEGLKIAADYI